MNSRAEQCLAHARAAEGHAKTAMDAYVRENWLRIATSYRHLAQVRLDLSAVPSFARHERNPAPAANWAVNPVRGDKPPGKLRDARSL
jgi:hypothetical protein